MIILFRFLNRTGAHLVSTWVLKLKEHVGEHEDLLKTCTIVIGNDYALAA